MVENWFGAGKTYLRLICGVLRVGLRFSVIFFYGSFDVGFKLYFKLAGALLRAGLSFY